MCPVRMFAPAHDLTLTFPPDPVWVRNAREAVRTAMSTVVPTKPELIDTAVLLTSEVVTNAVIASAHSLVPGPVAVRAGWTDDGELHVLVQDVAPGAPVCNGVAPGPAAAEQEHGRGLVLLALQAADWGVCHHVPGQGKAVWFRLAVAEARGAEGSGVGAAPGTYGISGGGPSAPG